MPSREQSKISTAVSRSLESLRLPAVDRASIQKTIKASSEKLHNMLRGIAVSVGNAAKAVTNVASQVVDAATNGAPASPSAAGNSSATTTSALRASLRKDFGNNVV